MEQRGISVDEEMEMPLLFSSGPSEDITDLLKRVNSYINTFSGRTLGVHRLKELLLHGNETVLLENAASWLKILSLIIRQDRYCPIATENFRTILSQASQVSSISREISTNFIPTTLTSFLQVEVKNFAIISAIESILSSYPTSCGSHRSHIVKCFIPLMSSSLEEERACAFRCWALIPFLGGGGPQRSTHSQQWQTQMSQTINYFKYMVKIYTGVGKDESSDPSYGSLSLPFPSLPTKEPEISEAVIQRVCGLCNCLRSLLEVDFPHALPVPVATIINIIINILDLTPSQLGRNAHMVLRASYLHEIHGRVLQLFGRLMKICKRNLCRYSSQINRTFSSLLDLWQDKSPTAVRDKKHHVIRETVYETILEWMQTCGSTTRFLCGSRHLNQRVLKHIVDDIKPVKDIIQVSEKPVNSGAGKKAKRRRLAENDLLAGASSERIRNPNANEKLTIAALKVASEAVTTLGHRLSPDIHRALQEVVIPLLLETQQSGTVEPYHSNPSPRLHLYKLLLALTLSPSTTLAPPTALATKIFSFATSHEKNSEIRSFCANGISSLNNLVHPWRNTWHKCTVESQALEERSQNDAFIEPMNVRMEFDEGVKPNGIHSNADTEGTIDDDAVENGSGDNSVKEIEEITTVEQLSEEDQVSYCYTEQNGKTGLQPEEAEFNTTVETEQAPVTEYGENLRATPTLSETCDQNSYDKYDIIEAEDVATPYESVAKITMIEHQEVNDEKAPEEPSEEVQNMLLDFVDDSVPDET